MKTAIASYRLVEAQVVPKIEKICTNSEFSRQNIRKHLGRGDAEVVYPAVDLQDFECSDYQKFFFYPSRIVPEKRLEYAIEAFRIFSKREKSGWRLVIGGHLAPTKRNLQYLEEVKSQVAGLAVSFRLNLGGQGLAQLYSDCGATLFCAEREDFGLVPLESMASGKPCISVNEGGPRESIIDGKTGFLINSQQEMAERMLQLAGDRSLAEKMGKAGRKRVGQSYTWEIFLDKMGKAFKGAARGKTN
jgi:glycosyltransferase involved in cell wall biosynthesis